MEAVNTLRVFLLFRLAILRRGENQFTCHVSLCMKLSTCLEPPSSLREHG